MKPVVSPRELAAAIGVSESSMKRWADGGLLQVSKTAGGHRRIPIGEAIRFIRSVRAPLVRPELLGLSDASSLSASLVNPDAPGERLFTLLLDGNAREARGLILSLYLGGRSIAEIGDGPIRAAMERLGTLWQHDPAGISIEHRATDICIQAVQQLRLLVEPDAPKIAAVGGCPPGDPYALPTLLVATALASEGVQAINLGPDTPLDSIRLAAERMGAKLAWLSVSVVENAADLFNAIPRLAEDLAALNVPLLVGGHALPHLPGLSGPNLTVVSSLEELVATYREPGSALRSAAVEVG